ncbi:MAG: T9SS type A sorting domain-containing protein [Saprospiraceae bacterium]
MKKIYTVLALQLVALSCFTQVEFAPAGAEWFYQHTSGYTTAASSYDGFEQLRYTGDTLLDGRTFKVIDSRTFARSTSRADRSALHFLFQQADSVFEYVPETQQNRFLFRNNYAIGDVVFDEGGLVLRVQSVETMDFNGLQVRHFTVGNGVLPSPTGVYDLFGPEAGLFSSDPWERIADEGTVRLRCYTDAGFPQANVRNEPCDAILKPVDSAFTAQFSPNPARDEVRIFIDGIPSGLLHLRVFNAAGQLILEKNLAGSADRILVRQLPAGLYSCVFQDEKTTFHKKFVKY